MVVFGGTDMTPEIIVHTMGQPFMKESEWVTMGHACFATSQADLKTNDASKFDMCDHKVISITAPIIAFDCLIDSSHCTLLVSSGKYHDPTHTRVKFWLGGDSH